MEVYLPFSNSELELITSSLELELITRTKKGKTFYSPWHNARLKEGAA